MAQTPNVFVIFHRDPQGTPDFIYSYDSRLAGCITLSINIARAYLRNVTVQAALVSFAKDLDRSLPKNAWYNDPVHGCGGPAGAVSAFIGIILSVFPLIAVDDSQSNPDVLAYVGKRAWDGRFEPLEHPIMLNGQVRDFGREPDAIGQIKLTVIREFTIWSRQQREQDAPWTRVMTTTNNIARLPLSSPTPFSTNFAIYFRLF